MDCSPSGSSVHGISQAGILEWVAISFSRGSSLLSDQIHIFCLAARFFYHWITMETLHIHSVHSSLPKACGPGAQRVEAVSVPAQQSGKEQIPPSSAFFFFSSPQELGWTPPTMGHQLHSAPPSSNTNLFEEHLHRHIEESPGPLKLTISCILLDIVLYSHLYFLYYFTYFMYIHTYPSRKRNVYTSMCVCTDISLYTLFCTLIFFPI